MTGRITNWIGKEAVATGRAGNSKGFTVLYRVFKAKTLFELRLITDMIRFAKLNFEDCQSFRAYSAKDVRKFFISYGVAIAGESAPLGYALWNYYHKYPKLHSPPEKTKDIVLRQMAITYPAYQRCGIGWKLFQTCIDDLAVKVDQVIVESPNHRFYNFLISHGLTKIRIASFG